MVWTLKPAFAKRGYIWRKQVFYPKYWVVGKNLTQIYPQKGVFIHSFPQLIHTAGKLREVKREFSRKKSGSPMGYRESRSFRRS